MAPGLTPVAVEHAGNTTESVEEAREVMRLVADLLGRAYTGTKESSDGPVRAPPRPLPLRQADLIVVTPYNAQLALVREHLDRAGFPEVPVGTVDKFQGQEAAVAIVSLAASSAAVAPRGVEFLLLKNRRSTATCRAGDPPSTPKHEPPLGPVDHTKLGISLSLDT